VLIILTGSAIPIVALDRPGRCTCGAPTGSACTATVSIYKGTDLTCSGQGLEQKAISSEGPVCLDMALPGQPLGSKSAGPTTYLPAAGRALRLPEIRQAARAPSPTAARRNLLGGLAKIGESAARTSTAYKAARV